MAVSQPEKTPAIEPRPAIKGLSTDGRTVEPKGSDHRPMEGLITTNEPLSTEETVVVGPPPDGGLVAWVQVLAGHLVIFSTWGFTISFGIFQPYYEQTLSLDPSAVSWIGSVQTCLIFLVGTLSGRAFDAGHYILIFLIGSLLQLVGIFTTSVSTTYWQLFLSQGICQGLGCGLVFVPTIANTSTYFSKKKTLALSAAACGGGTGGLIFPLIAQQLLPKVGFGWTVRAMGLVVLITSIIVLLLVRTRLPPRKSGPILDLDAFKETPYLFFALSMFFTLWATYFSYSYARAYALDRLGATQSTSFNMLMIINGVGIPGRLVPAFLADKWFGAVNVFVPTILAAAICIFSWAGVSTVAGDYVWVVAFGFFGAGIQGMFPATLAGLSKDLSKSGTRIGMIFTIVSVVALTGPPLAGRLIVVAGGSYIGAQIWGGVCLCIGCALLVVAAWAKRRDDLKSKHEQELDLE